MSISIQNRENRIVALEKRKIENYFIVPDYARYSQLAATYSNYTVPSNGFMVFDGQQNSSNDMFVTINGVQLNYGRDYGSDQEPEIRIIYPVAAGDKVSWRNITGYGGQGVKFIPIRKIVV